MTSLRLRRRFRDLAAILDPWTIKAGITAGGMMVTAGSTIIAPLLVPAYLGGILLFFCTLELGSGALTTPHAHKDRKYWRYEVGGKIVVVLMGLVGMGLDALGYVLSHADPRFDIIASIRTPVLTDVILSWLILAEAMLVIRNAERSPWRRYVPPFLGPLIARRIRKIDEAVLGREPPRRRAYDRMALGEPPAEEEAREG